MKPISKDLVELHIANILIEKIKNKFLKVTIHKDFVLKVILIILLTLCGFVLQSYVGLPNYIIAFSATVVLALLTAKKIDIHESLQSVEWTTLFFFAGLFIMVAGIEKTGILEIISQSIVGITTNITLLTLLILWISAFVSMIVDNIPFVTVMIPVIVGIQTQFYGVDTTILWWALSLGACLGGNGTLIGASANVISADIARKKDVHITFLNYLKFSLPFTVGILAICSIYIIAVTM